MRNTKCHGDIAPPFRCRHTHTYTKYFKCAHIHVYDRPACTSRSEFSESHTHTRSHTVCSYFFVCERVRLRISNVCSQVYYSSGKIYLYGNGLPERMKRAPSGCGPACCAHNCTLRNRPTTHPSVARSMHVYVSVLAFVHAFGCYKDIVCTLSDFAMAYTHTHLHAHTLCLVPCCHILYLISSLCTVARCSSANYRGQYNINTTKNYSSLYCSTRTNVECCI